jgi:hypothetical protein
MEHSTEFELVGTVSAIAETQTRANATFREVVLDCGYEFKNQHRDNPVAITLTGDKCALADPLDPGDVVQVEGRIGGRRWEVDGRSGFSTRLYAAKIKVLEAAPAATDAPAPDETPEDEPMPF